MDIDTKAKGFFGDPTRFADLINGLYFRGEEIMQPGDLQELDTQVILESNQKRLNNKGKKSYSKIRNYRKTRDLLKKTAFGMNFVVIGIENQEKVDYSLPLRNMLYDAGSYEHQAIKIRRNVRQDVRAGKQKHISNGEYLYGFRKESRLLPVVTIVLYYGQEWDGTKDLHGIIDFTDIPEQLRELVNNYKLNLVEVRKLTDTSMFKTDIRLVFDFIRYSKDKKKLKELVTKEDGYKNLDEDAYDLMAMYGREARLMERKADCFVGGKANMCIAIDEMIEDGRIEGRSEGRSEGLACGKELFAKLAERLLTGGRQEDLLRAISDKEYREILFAEFGIEDSNLSA